MKYLMKYFIDFIVLVFLYVFVFFRKWKAQGRDSLLVNTLMYAYLSGTLFYYDAGGRIYPIHTGPSL